MKRVYETDDMEELLEHVYEYVKKNHLLRNKGGQVFELKETVGYKYKCTMQELMYFSVLPQSANKRAYSLLIKQFGNVDMMVNILKSMPDERFPQCDQEEKKEDTPQQDREKAIQKRDIELILQPPWRSASDIRKLMWFKVVDEYQVVPDTFSQICGGQTPNKIWQIIDHGFAMVLGLESIPSSQKPHEHRWEGMSLDHFRMYVEMVRTRWNNIRKTAQCWWDCERGVDKEENGISQYQTRIHQMLGVDGAFYQFLEENQIETDGTVRLSALNEKYKKWQKEHGVAKPRGIAPNEREKLAKRFNVI